MGFRFFLLVVSCAFWVGSCSSSPSTEAGDAATSLDDASIGDAKQADIDGGIPFDASIQTDADTPDAMPPMLVDGEVWCAIGGITIEVNGVEAALMGSGPFSVQVPGAVSIDAVVTESPPGKQCEVVDTNGMAGYDGRVLIRCWGAASMQLAYDYEVPAANLMVDALFHNFLDEDGCASPSVLVGPEPLGESVRSFLFSGDNDALLYRAKTADTSFAYQLFSAPLALSGVGLPARVNPLTTATSGVTNVVAIPGRSLAFYWTPSTATELPGEYYSDLAALATEPVRMTAPLLGVGHGGDNFISNDGTKFVFTAAPTLPSQNPFLWLIDLSSNAPFTPQLVNNVPPSGERIYTGFDAMAQDGSKVAYQQGNPRRVYVADISSGTPETPVLMHDEVVGESVVSRGFTPNGEKLVLHKTTIDTQSLVVVDVSGLLPGTAETVDITLVPYGQIHSVQLSPDSQKLVYVAEGESPAIRDAYYVDISGAVPGPPIRLTSATTGFTTSTRTIWSDDGDNYLFKVDGEILWVDTSAGTPAIPVRVNPPQQNYQSPGNGFFGPNGDSIIYGELHSAYGTYDLFWVDISTGIPSSPIKISPNLPNGALIARTSVMGNFLFFSVKFAGTNEGDTLYALPFDSSGPLELQRIVLPSPTGLSSAPRLDSHKVTSLPTN